ncbi:chymotrypsin-1-like [Aphidius gifuensis]|uniref:chymotrypsin-1-like n=1 Tax=Aphidius gifuensis TaxID=684658 RepID=UPI001CDB6E41|nr:chymotrypsin-1-like [Aphidius gifuensis]
MSFAKTSDLTVRFVFRASIIFKSGEFSNTVWSVASHAPAQPSHSKIFSFFSGTPGKKPKKIVNGEKARSEQEFPYQVSIRIDNNHACGGAIIDETHILTVAHCVTERNGNPVTDISIFSVLVGTLDSSPWFPTLYNIQSIEIHEEYEPWNNFINDIAIITTKLIFNENQQPIGLPEADVLDGSVVVLSGWGDLNNFWEYFNRPSFLRMLDTTVVSNELCENSHHRKIYSQQLCVLKGLGYGACYGDSGSPLVYNKTLVGLGSWVTKCAAGIPDVCTRVYTFVSWIKEKIRIESLKL